MSHAEPLQVEPQRGAPVSAPTAKRATGAVAAHVAALVVVALLGWRANLVATNDGPQHAFGALVYSAIDQPELGFADYLTPNVSVTSHGYRELLQLLLVVAEFPTAYRLSIAALAVLFALAAALLTAGIRGRLVAFDSVLALAAFQGTLYLGFFPFIVGLSVGMMAAAALYTRLRTTIALPVFSGALLLAAFCHPVGAILGGMAALPRAASHHRPWRALLAIGVAGVPAAALVWLARGTTSADPGAAVWLPLGERLVNLGHGFVPGPTWRWGLLLGAALVGVVLGLRSSDRQRRALAVVAAVIYLTIACTPKNWGAWQLAYLRPLPLAGVIGIAILPIERANGTLRRLIHAGAIAYFLATAIWLDRYHLLLRRDVDPIADAIAALPRAPRMRFPIVVAPVPPAPAPASMVPWMHGGSLAAATVGGSVAYAQTNDPVIHAALVLPEAKPEDLPTDIRDPPVFRTEAQLRHFLPTVIALASPYEGLIVLLDEPRPWLADSLAGYGYRLVADRRHASLYDFVGCQVGFEVRGQGVAQVTLGVRNSTQPAAHLTATRAGDLAVTIARFPCGMIWLQAVSGSATCSEADQNGYLWAHASAQSPAHLACTLTERH